MKSVVVTEVHRLLFRPNVSERAQHYGITFLNQVVLSRKDAVLARTLVSAYLSLFRQQLAVKRDLENKTLTALLAGVHRALPFTVKDKASDSVDKNLKFIEGKPADGEDKDGQMHDALEEHVDNIFKMVYVSTLNTAIQALQVLYQATNVSGQTPSARYYRALYARLGSVELITSSKHALFLNLLFKSLRADGDAARVKAFVKRLLQVCAASHVTFCVGSLILVSELLSASPALAVMLDWSNNDQGDATASIHVQASGGKDKENRESNGSVDAKRKGAKAGVKVASEQNGDTKKEDVEFQVGDDVVVQGLMSATQYNGCQGVVRGHEGDRCVVHIEGVDQALRVKPANLTKISVTKTINREDDDGTYDPYKRDPEYGHAESEKLWELHVLKNHFHPTVRLFAEQLIKGERVEYQGDALADFQPINFLDKFVYKKPKKRKEDANTRGGSLMQRIGADEDANLKVRLSSVCVRCICAYIMTHALTHTHTYSRF
jgi:ribosome biogenesis protein MAK21